MQVAKAAEQLAVNAHEGHGWASEHMLQKRSVRFQPRVATSAGCLILPVGRTGFWRQGPFSPAFAVGNCRAVHPIRGRCSGQGLHRTAGGAPSCSPAVSPGLDFTGKSRACSKCCCYGVKLSRGHLRATCHWSVSYAWSHGKSNI